MSRQQNNQRRRPAPEQGPKNYRDPGMKRFSNFWSNVTAYTYTGTYDHAVSRAFRRVVSNALAGR